MRGKAIAETSIAMIWHCAVFQYMAIPFEGSLHFLTRYIEIQWAAILADQEIHLYGKYCYILLDISRYSVVFFYDDIAVSQEHWWPGLQTFVSTYMNGCGQCQQFKIKRGPTKPALFPISSSPMNCPFVQLSMDFITSLPLSGIFDSIMVVVDHGLTKGIILIPCTEKGLTTYEITRLFIKNVYKQFGLSDKVITDRGGQFDFLFFQELCKVLEIKSALITAFHPQSDGSTE